MSTITQRKVRIGTVTSNKPDKTVIIEVQRQVTHPKLNKIVRYTKKYHAHDEKNECNVGDTIKIMETRPLSKLKRWRLYEILDRAK
jgi:small subunit ribosomal protein S17